MTSAEPMVRALGYSNAPFNPFKPGRLCRGRERWIEAWEAEPDEDGVEVHRFVMSGATFTDLSAADALRGLPHSGLDAADLIRKLFPRMPLLAFMEDGHPADIPDDALGVELYDGYRAGGRIDAAMVRWCKRVNTIADVRQLLGDEGENRLRGFAVVKSNTEDETLFDELFQLVGMATLDSPPARFQPGALPTLVKKVKALILIHRDKHGLSVGIYSEHPIDPGNKLEKACDAAGTLLVPFAIPPMLARWDRALTELRDAWTKDDPFPVPEPEGGYTWENRRRRRGRKDRKRSKDEAEASPEESSSGETVDVAAPAEPIAPEVTEAENRSEVSESEMTQPDSGDAVSD